MKILFVWSAAEFATYDVARGYRDALARAGHDISDYRLYNRLKYHAAGLSQMHPPMHRDTELVVRLASEAMVVEALRERADLVVGICGMGLHPDGVELLTRAGFPVAMIFTEAPYDDAHHVAFAKYVGHPFSNEVTTAREQGWGYLGAAYDPDRHRPVEATGARDACDVLILGTGWPERIALLEKVDWTGINLRILGWWSGIKRGSPLARYYKVGAVENADAVRRYASAKVCINQHRFHATAESLNPRAIELGACGALQVSDYRRELPKVYGNTVEVYESPEDLSSLLRHLLALSEPERRARAKEQRAKLLSGRHTFDDRVATMLAAINSGGHDGKDSRSRRAALLAGVRRNRSPILERG